MMSLFNNGEHSNVLPKEYRQLETGMEGHAVEVTQTSTGLNPEPPPRTPALHDVEQVHIKKCAIRRNSENSQVGTTWSPSSSTRGKGEGEGLRVCADTDTAASPRVRVRVHLPRLCRDRATQRTSVDSDL